MDIHIAIADDSREDRERLRDGITEIFRDDSEHTLTLRLFDSGEALLRSYRPGMFTLVFLDILMDGMNGIELSRRLRERDAELLIVFLTSSPEFAFDAFPIHPFDYLVKPCGREQLERVIREMLRTVHRDGKVISVRAAYTTYQIPVSSIYSVVALGHSVELRAGDRTVRSIMTFTELKDLLYTEPRFLECNRGVMVNMDHVESVNEGTLRLTDGSSYALRTRGRAELISQFTQYQISRLKRR